jgi:hypothetical protein
LLAIHSPALFCFFFGRGLIWDALELAIVDDASEVAAVPSGCFLFVSGGVDP